MNILFTSAGRRVSLIELFKKNLNKDDKVYASDCDQTAPALYVVDQGIIVPKINDPNYIQYLITIIKKNKITLLIPLLDPELPILSVNKEKIEPYGSKVMISSPNMINMSYDKYQTYRSCEENNIPVPKTYLFSLMSETGFKTIKFPVLVKPRFGSASLGIQKCNSWEELLFYGKRGPDILVQEYLRGEEVTADLLLNFQSELVSYALRKRLKIRAGEVERGITIKNLQILEIIKKFTKIFRFLGPINIQFIITEKGPMLLEVNPRFGGGYPLSYYAGANFPKMIIDMINGIKVKSNFRYKQDCLMLRYDEAIFQNKIKLI